MTSHGARNSGFLKDGGATIQVVVNGRELEGKERNDRLAQYW